MKNVVVLDFGSNSVRLSINQMHERNGKTFFKEIKRLKDTTRLAEGMGESRKKQLSAAAIERTLAAVRHFKDIYQSYPEYQVYAIATAAVREAQNSQIFLEQIKQLTGCAIKVLSGETEAYYDYLGAANSLALKDFLITDMGGGSCELILVKAGAMQERVSLPYGAVSLTERFCYAGQLSAARLFEFQNFISDKLGPLSWLQEANTLPLVLMGGCNRTVARIQRVREGYTQIDNIHGYTVSTGHFFQIYKTFLKKNVVQREHIAGMEPARADIILGGMTPVVYLLQQLHSAGVVFSESGAREGFLYELLQKQEQAKKHIQFENEK
ncbi:Ppx/GppA family phosphatase [Liquorilactobacillus satsumensis]|uniref:Ppx/GppA phosphatase family protein n=1 Tax=Liquorilactobacillus satsumensis TaxID=259059 RepID=UPI001E658AF0|nr:Ppx/GppA family phosphatase [Liquorilactobacillus satsumensis]MCC7667044.1 exopolyphosphatase [Liquorilactobacillus satsumensis]MCP9358115.1 Ppx/GppA family phosphatase [Liquorilactobacillus satsumensis]MCP9372126.1 Ppx/GppA family phosphatase [Liquorilactobacillus satsumensis]